MNAPPAPEPTTSRPGDPSIELVIEGRPRDLGGFMVRRILPSAARRLVGPFIFFDEMGPAQFRSGEGLDVRPHPHIALATVTYMFDGEILHRDTLGWEQPIQPGAVNFMVAGRGIAHSERSSSERRKSGGRLHGIQTWLAVPTAAEESAPSFVHHPANTIPTDGRDGVELRVVLGSAFGMTSPVQVVSPTLYVEARFKTGTTLAVPEVAERAACVIEGRIECDGQVFQDGAMMVFRPGSRPVLRALEPSRVMVLGGEPLDGPRNIWWNFVSSSKERIDRAKADWREGRFGKIPGDDHEFIPLPEDWPPVEKAVPIAVP